MFYNKQIFKRCFSFPKKYWYKNIKYIPLYFRLMHDLIKYGYDEYATWEIFSWFTNTMCSVLERYREGHCGVPILIDNYPFDSSANDEESKKLRQQNDEMWDDIIEKMIDLLKLPAAFLSCLIAKIIDYRLSGDCKTLDILIKETREIIKKCLAARSAIMNLKN